MRDVSKDTRLAARLPLFKIRQCPVAKNLRARFDELLHAGDFRRIAYGLNDQALRNEQLVQECEIWPPAIRIAKDPIHLLNQQRNRVFIRIRHTDAFHKDDPHRC